MVRNKEQQKQYNRQYRQNHKEKTAEYDKKYRQNHKEQKAEINRQYYQNYKEKKKQYQQEHKEHISDYRKQYSQTPQGKMSNRISGWKQNGVKLQDEYGDNWEIFYEQEYLATTHCEECNVELTEDKHNTSTTRCLDHCHQTGLFRNVLCQACNVKRR